MTVIAWDGKTLAADKRSTLVGLPTTTTKIGRAPCGALLGAAGETSMCRELRAWWISGASADKYPDKDKSSNLLVIEPSGRTLLYLDGPFPVEVEDKFTAMGSGRDYAIAAMHFGYSAREAVELACKYETSCGNGIDTLTLDARTPPQ